MGRAGACLLTSCCHPAPRLLLASRPGVCAVMCCPVLPRYAVATGLQLSLRHALPVFRCVGAAFLVPFLWGLNVVVWRRARINYLLLFSSDVRVSLGPRQVRLSSSGRRWTGAGTFPPTHTP